MKKNTGSRFLFYSLNIVLPLLCGLLLYLTLRRDAYVSVFIGRFISLPASSFETIPPRLAYFLRNYASDILWAWSLTFAVTLILGRSRRDRIIVFVLCIGFEILLEILQSAGVLPGTFDFIDILLEACSICLSLLIIKIYEEKRNEKSIQDP